MLSVRAQQTDFVDFKTAYVKLEIKPMQKEVSGEVTYLFDVLKPADSIFIDAQKMEFDAVLLNDKKVEVNNDGRKLWLLSPFKPSVNNEISFMYKAKPKKAMYFIGWNNEGRNQVWTQGQGKYTSNWLPSFDDMNEKVEFDLSVAFDKDYEVIANGKLVGSQISEGNKVWHYDMKQPMSSYLLAIAIGKYDRKIERSKSGTLLEMHYYPEDSLKVESTYRYTKRMFDFLEEEIGVVYPWQNYKQVPVKDFLYAGMENTSITIFSDAFMVDDIGFVDKNYVNVNAHELAHQWFGDMVTAKSGTHHWLQEGFATYYALLAEREVFGESYYYWRLSEYVDELVGQENAGKSTSLLNPKSSSITFYKKGALVLHMLREEVGDKLFRKAVKSYLNKFQYINVETDDFIREVEKVSNKDLSEFVAFWLMSDSFDIESIMAQYDNDLTIFIRHILLPECGAEKCEDYLLNDERSEIDKVKVIKRYPKYITKNLFRNGSLLMRQAIAENFSRIPLNLKTDYEALLNDRSYLTNEIALFNLCNNFPDDIRSYLEQTKGIVGFNDKNVRQLWLYLALVTSTYSEAEEQTYLNELIGYTDPVYGFEVRQNAFQYLVSMWSCEEKCTENLKQATTHHNWRFKSFAKQLLKQKNSKSK